MARSSRCSAMWRRSPSWYTVSGPGIIPSPSRVRYASRPPVAASMSEIRWPIQPGGHRHLGDDDLPGRVGELGDVALGEQAAQHLVARPLDRGDGGDAEPLVDLGAARVVDARDDVLDAVLLARDASREDVGVVTAGDGGEGVGVVDAGGPQGVAVEADSLDGVALEAGAETPERGLVLVDDGHLVPGTLDGPGEGRADTAAAHDHEVHGADATPSVVGSVRLSRNPCTARGTCGIQCLSCLHQDVSSSA